MILSEDTSPTDDDSRARIKAREELLKVTMGKIGMDLINAAKAVNGSKVSMALGSFSSVLTEYKYFRDQARVLMHGDKVDLTYYRIDRHKIGAAFLLAILNIRPLRLEGSSLPATELEKYLNPILAFKTAISILGIYVKHESRVDSGKDIDKAIFPVANGQHSYLQHAYRKLDHVAKNNLTLPLIAVAHWLFYIERYWRFSCLLNDLHTANAQNPALSEAELRELLSQTILDMQSCFDVDHDI